MNFNQFVVRNTIRNKHLYLAYFFSTLFAVMVFFTFTVFAYHPDLAEGTNQAVRNGMLSAAVIIIGYAFFFVLYSMDIFLQSRKKEFGMLMMQGMSPRQLRKMVFVENIVIGFFATIIGIFCGFFFSQGILWLSGRFIHVYLTSYLPSQAIILTFIAFLLLFFAISFFIQFKLPKLKVQDLLKSNETGKGEIKYSPIKAILGVLFILVGYSIALLIPAEGVPIVMLPVILLVIAGTRFLFNQFSVWFVQKVKKNTNRFWKKTNMIVFSDLAYRMKDNARSFFLVSIISTVAFAAIGTLYGFQNLILEQYDRIPYEFFYRGSSDETRTFSKKFEQTLSDEKVEYQKETVTLLYDSENDLIILNQEQYNQLAKSIHEDPLEEKNGGIQLEEENGVQSSRTVSKINVKGHGSLNILKKVTSSVYSDYRSVVVVPSNIFSKIQGNYEIEKMSIYQPKHLSFEKRNAIGKKYSEEYRLTAKTYMKQITIDSFAPILFVGLFIGIVFFVSAGSFLYFRLYSDMDIDIQKFKMVYKLGLTKKELEKMIFQQVGILFFTPIIVSAIHGAVALTAMYHMFKLGLQSQAIYVLVVFMLIQLIYYLIARQFYFKKVYRLVQK